MALIAPVEFVSKSGKRITVRHANPDEAEKILKALVEIAETSPYILSTAEDFRNRKIEDQKAWIEKSNQSEFSFYIIALHENKIISSADFVAYKDSKRGHRGGLGISVHQDYKGDGIGKRMMEILIQKASSFSKIKFIELDVMEVNQPAIQMYKNLGFKVLHTTPQAYQLSDGSFSANIMMRLEVKK